MENSSVLLRDPTDVHTKPNVNTHCGHWVHMIPRYTNLRIMSRISPKTCQPSEAAQLKYCHKVRYKWLLLSMTNVVNIYVAKIPARQGRLMKSNHACSSVAFKFLKCFSRSRGSLSMQWGGLIFCNLLETVLMCFPIKYGIPLWLGENHKDIKVLVNLSKTPCI